MASFSGQPTSSLPTSSFVTILCCMCGAQIQSNGLNMCGACIKSQIDITEGISKNANVHQCKRCLYYQTAKGNHWMPWEWESRELLSLCLKKIHGLHHPSIKLVDAQFIWTEPHSKRIKVKCSIQKEVANCTAVQSSFVCELKVNWQQCPECTKEFTAQTWKTVVQVRQHASHKRTFLFLEQLVLRRRLHDKAIDLQVTRDGMDFYFPDKQTANRFSDILVGAVPGKARSSRKMISEDRKNNVHKCQHSISIELVAACKDDLLLVGGRQARALGLPAAGLYLVAKVTSQLHLLHAASGARGTVVPEKYFKSPPTILFSAKQLQEYVVLDVDEPPGGAESGAAEDDEAPAGGGGGGKKKGGGGPVAPLVGLEVARAADWGANDRTLLLTTAALPAHHLEAGDSILGYDLMTANLDESILENVKGEIPDAVLVKKKPAKKLKKRKLQRGFFSGSRGKGGQGRANRETSTIADEDDDYQLFLQDLDQNPEMQAALGLDNKGNGEFSSITEGLPELDGIRESIEEEEEEEEDCDADGDDISRNENEAGKCEGENEPVVVERITVDAEQQQQQRPQEEDAGGARAVDNLDDNSHGGGSK